MFNILKLTKKCTHDKVTPDKDTAYCPDCGKLIQNEWYITRCACCGVKLKTMLKNGLPTPQFHYCSNCGGDEFKVEKLVTINFIDINFAALVKRVVEENSVCTSTTRCWQEKNIVQPKLPILYL